MATLASHSSADPLFNRSSSHTQAMSAGAQVSSASSDFSDDADHDDSVRNWDELRVAEWLKTIGAERYIAIFRENNITGENLMDMDQVMLKEMGVKKIGDRVRIDSRAKQFRYRDFERRRAKNRNSFATLVDVPARLSAETNLPRGARSNLRVRVSDTESPTSPRSPRVDELPRIHRKPVNNQATSPGEVRRGFQRPPPPSTDAGQTVRYRDTLDVPSKSNSAGLPSEMPLIRIIYDNGSALVVSIEGVKTSDDIIKRSLKKGNLNESLYTTYCLWVLDGTEPNTTLCRRVQKDEMLRLCLDGSRPERERLILRKIHAGEPEMLQLKASARLAQSQKMQAGSSPKSPLPSIAFPMSPNSAAERERHLNSAAMDLERSASKILLPPRRRPRKAKEFAGGRPPSELIVADTATWFPEASRAEIERVARMSIRRSQRLSRATSRLSIASNVSSLSGLRMQEEDVPPIPSIADTYLKDGAVRARPLSILRLGRPNSYRESIASSMLDPVDEESSPEPNRKSYVSFTSQSEIEDGSWTVTDGNNSINEQIRIALEEDGEPPDEELNEFLRDESYDNIKYIRGKLIGQGSFGSVYLALHAFTAELMAVKQVALPNTQSAAVDAKRNHMVEALKREIALLRELKHPHIVQYLGSSSESETLNIFLEYIPGGSIAKMLVDFGSLSEDIVSKFVRQILVGLAYLHSRDIIHRDIKGANILVDNHGQVKISDFGISKRVQDSKTLLENGDDSKPKGRGAFANNRVSLQGSVFWMAPEVVKQTAHTRKADIWSLGCLIVEMLTGSHPHPNCTQLQAIFKIGGKGVGGNADPSPEIPAKASAPAREFLKSTFRMEHEERPEAEELLAYSFVKARQLAP